MTRNNTAAWDWTQSYNTLEAMCKDLGSSDLGVGWTDTDTDAILITLGIALPYTLYVWNGGNSALIREALMSHYHLHECNERG